MALPGAAPDSAGAPAASPKAKPAHSKKRAGQDKHAEPGVEAIAGQKLLYNGADGQLALSVADKVVHLDAFTLPGEVISDPSQKCRIDIVSQTPIEARSEGRPDGLERYTVDIPACPLTFDVLDGAVLVPTQTTACVFQAADCQASPGGLWGPAGATLEGDAKAISKARDRAEASITTSLKTLEGRSKGEPVAALTREQNEFPGQRDDICRDYAREALHGFCAARLTQARAALLRKRVDDTKRPAKVQN